MGMSSLSTKAQVDFQFLIEDTGHWLVKIVIWFVVNIVTHKKDFRVDQWMKKSGNSFRNESERNIWKEWYAWEKKSPHQIGSSQ